METTRYIELIFKNILLLKHVVYFFVSTVPADSTLEKNSQFVYYAYFLYFFAVTFHYFLTVLQNVHVTKLSYIFVITGC